MNRAIATGLFFAGMSVLTAAYAAQGGMVVLLDGTEKSLGNFSQAGNANWRVGPGEQNGGSTVYADLGTGFLVTKESYDNFRIRAEVYLDANHNSGIFIRCEDPQEPGADSCYEVNLFDTRPDKSYGTGAIVNVPGATVNPMPTAANKWNVMEVEARGTNLIVRLNGQQTVNVNDSKHARGRIALQRGAGKVMWRKVEIERL
jgi:Domain of Unknown Function (DUF1080)